MPESEQHKATPSDKKVFNDIGVGLVSGGFAAAIGVGVTGGLAGGQHSCEIVIGAIITFIICVASGYLFIRMSK